MKLMLMFYGEMLALSSLLNGGDDTLTEVFLLCHGSLTMRNSQQ